MIVFTSIIIVLVKINKKASKIDLPSWNRTGLSEHEEQDQRQQPLARGVTTGPTTTSESTTNGTLDDDDMDYAITKVAVVATNKNIAYECTPATAIEQTEFNTNKEHVYAQIR